MVYPQVGVATVELLERLGPGNSWTCGCGYRVRESSASPRFAVLCVGCSSRAARRDWNPPSLTRATDGRRHVTWVSGPRDRRRMGLRSRTARAQQLLIDRLRRGPGGPRLTTGLLAAWALAALASPATAFGRPCPRASRPLVGRLAAAGNSAPPPRGDGPPGLHEPGDRHDHQHQHPAEPRPAAPMIPTSTAVTNVVVRVTGIVHTRLDLTHAGTPDQMLGLSLGTVLTYLRSAPTARKIADGWAAAAVLADTLTPAITGRSPVVVGQSTVAVMARLAGSARSATRSHWCRLSTRYRQLGHDYPPGGCASVCTDHSVCAVSQARLFGRPRHLTNDNPRPSFWPLAKERVDCPPPRLPALSVTAVSVHRRKH